MPDSNDGDGAAEPSTDQSPDPASDAETDAADEDASHDESTDERHDDPATAQTQSVVESVGDPDIDAVVGERRTLHGKVRILWVVRRILPALFLAAVVGFGAYTLELVGNVQAAAGVGVAVFAVVMGYAVVRALLLYRSWRYVVREDSLYLRRGVFTIVQTIVPYVRVQHIDTRRSALERVLGLSSLVVYTAGSRGADVTIPGLTPDRAEKLQSRLKRLAIESEDEDAV